jgi:hypothetical protein
MNPPRLAVDIPWLLFWVAITAASIAAWVAIIDYGYGLFFG